MIKILKIKNQNLKFWLLKEKLLSLFYKVIALYS